MDSETNPGLLDKTEEGGSPVVEDNVECKTSSFRLGVWEIYLKYLDRCSLTGVPFIRNSENRYVKVVWSLLLFCAVFVMTGHLVMLFKNYYKFETHAKVVYQFSSLPFPAITFCNVNPIRKSLKGLAWPNYYWDYDPFSPDSEVNLTYSIDALDLDDSYKNSEPEDYASSSVFDDFFERALDKIYRSQNKTRGANVTIEDMLAGKSAFYEIQTMFRNRFASVDGLTRSLIGHQLSDMIVECYYNGYKCNTSCFSQTPSITFGNCYTLQCDNFVSTKSGPDNGLTLILRLELDEYLPLLAESKGAILVVHDRDTVAFPSEDGIALTAGSDNLIGLRQRDIHRLEAPYGDCKHNSKLKYFGFDVTRNTCLKICKLRQIQEMCGCFDNKLPQIIKKLHLEEHSFCMGKELECVAAIERNFSDSPENCNCKNPCMERSFEKTISTRQWPSPDFTKLLVESACLKTPETCDTLKNKTELELKEEFLKVNVYYEDLNHEVYTDTPDYEGLALSPIDDALAITTASPTQTEALEKLSQFLSDIGGTIGLWIGMSILGVFEVVHLVTELVIYSWRSLFYATRRRADNYRPC